MSERGSPTFCNAWHSPWTSSSYLARVPLGMHKNRGLSSMKADQERLHVLAAASQDLARAVMEVKMHELQHVPTS